MTAPRKRFRHAPLLALGLVVLLAGGGMFLLVRSFLHSTPAPTKPVVQEIRLIRPPPPPPETPPPPPQEKEVEVKAPDPPPDQTPSNEPPPQQLGLDAEGGAGGDAFGLLGNKGGRDLMASGGSALAYYSGQVKNQILDELQKETELRAGAGGFRAELHLWVRSDGTVERVTLAHSTGDPARDRAIERALSRITKVQPPPPDTPQPIKFGIVNRA